MIKRFIQVATGIWILVVWMFSLSWQFKMAMGFVAAYWWWLLFSPYLIVLWLGCGFVGICARIEKSVAGENTAWFKLILLAHFIPLIIWLMPIAAGVYGIVMGIKGPIVITGKEMEEDLEKMNASL